MYVVVIEGNHINITTNFLFFYYIRSNLWKRVISINLTYNYYYQINTFDHFNLLPVTITKPNTVETMVHLKFG